MGIQSNTNNGLKTVLLTQLSTLKRQLANKELAIGEYMDILPTCSICRKIIQETDNTFRCPHCETQYHLTHLAEWIKVNGYCPMCHARIPSVTIFNRSSSSALRERNTIDTD